MSNALTEDSENIGRGALRKATWRLLPLLGLGYLIAYIDRVNISFAALQMNHELGFSATVYGLGGGLFFLSYAAFEVPSNLALIRFGARRWIARIMVTWGLLAIGMMFVRTPTQFYVMRLLLGAAEAGFFPGVIYYLMNWFPATQRGRAISRFYLALPLSGILMGVVAGPLLSLRGLLGLSGWQWLFLAEGLPAVLVSVLILRALPDGPHDAKWLSEEERAWLLGTLAAEKRSGPKPTADHGFARTLGDWRIWLLGAANICILGVAYAFNLSAPAILREGTHWSIANVGYLTAFASVLGAGGMIAAGVISDRLGDRYLSVAIFLLAMAIGYAVMGHFTAPWVTVSAYATSVIFANAAQGGFWTIPGERFHGRSAAAAIAAIGSIGMIGAASGPYLWGIARDRFGGFQVGLLALSVGCLLAVLIIGLARRVR